MDDSAQDRTPHAAPSAGVEAMPTLGHVDTWVFDLDNTLYPATSELFSQIDRRMGGFIADLLGLDEAAARHLQKTYFLRYGTTLRGLMLEHGVAPEAFLEHVHDIDLAALVPDPRLRDALAGLRGRRIVYTNGSARHAERVLARLGIAHLFDGIFDLVAAGYEPKPAGASFDRFLAAFSIVPGRAAMIEDMARNLVPAAARGMTTVWLRTAYAWGAVDHEAAAVDHEVSDLPGFLEAQA